MASDTHPDVEAVLTELLRQTPVWRKLELAASLNQMARTLAMNGLRERHPHSSEAELRRRLSGMLLGEELAQRAYGPLPHADGDGVG